MVKIEVSDNDKGKECYVHIEGKRADIIAELLLALKGVCKKLDPDERFAFLMMLIKETSPQND